MEAIKWEYIAQPAGIMSPAISRVAFCLYLLKFTGTSKRKKYLFWFFIISQLVVNVATFVEVLISCSKYAMLWDKSIEGRCWSPKIQAYVGFFQGAWNSTTDLILTFLPFLILKNLNMKGKTKLGLSILLGLSIIAMIACVIKTIELKALGDPDDFTMSTVNFVIWFTIEQYVVIIVASIPTLRPLVMKLSKHFILFRGFKEFWKVSDSNTCSEHRPGTGCTTSHSPHPKDCHQSWRPNAVRLNSQKTFYDKLRLEPPYIHAPPRDPPEPGTIRRTVSVYIEPATSRDDLGPSFQTSITANGQTHLLVEYPWRQTRTMSGRRSPGQDLEMQ